MIFPGYQDGSNVTGMKLKGQTEYIFFIERKPKRKTILRNSLNGLFTEDDSLSPGEWFASTEVCLFVKAINFRYPNHPSTQH